MNHIKLGNCYVFTKSGNKVKVLASCSVKLNGKTVHGYTVQRIDSDKTLFAPKGSLLSL